METTQSSWQTWKTFFTFFHENKICLKIKFWNENRKDWLHKVFQKPPKHSALTTHKRVVSRFFVHRISKNSSLIDYWKSPKTLKTQCFCELKAHPQTCFEPFFATSPTLISLLQNGRKCWKTLFFSSKLSTKKLLLSFISVSKQTFVWHAFSILQIWLLLNCRKCWKQLFFSSKLSTKKLLFCYISNIDLKLSSLNWLLENDRKCWKKLFFSSQLSTKKTPFELHFCHMANRCLRIGLRRLEILLKKVAI